MKNSMFSISLFHTLWWRPNIQKIIQEKLNFGVYKPPYLERWEGWEGNFCFITRSGLLINPRAYNPYADKSFFYSHLTCLNYRYCTKVMEERNSLYFYEIRKMKILFWRMSAAASSQNFFKTFSLFFLQSKPNSSNLKESQSTTLTSWLGWNS